MLIVPSQKSYYYPYCIGGKTGFTDEAGNCLVTAASKDDVEFIAVCLNSGTLDSGLSERFLDCKTLFDFAFANYTTYYKDLQVNLQNLINTPAGPESSLADSEGLRECRLRLFRLNLKSLLYYNYFICS